MRKATQWARNTVKDNVGLLPTGSEERGVLRFGSIPVAILPSGRDVETIAL